MGSDDNGGSGERFLVRAFVAPDGARITGRTSASAASPAPATGRETRGSNGAACPADEDAPRPRPSSPHRTLGIPSKVHSRLIESPGTCPVGRRKTQGI